MKKNIWILTDNRIGSKHQAEGIADCLDKTVFQAIEKNLVYTRLAALPNFIRSKTLIGLDKPSKDSLAAPYPDVVLSSSRRTAPVARWLKKQNPKTILIQLGHIGRTGIKDFSLIFAPKHDKNKCHAPNIRYTIGCPHFITADKLNEAHQKWQEKFARLPRPLTAVIIGGAIKKHKFSLENAENLALAVKNLKDREGGSLLITTSRRTGAEAEQKIMSILDSYPHYAYLWGAKDENPYLGFLACADNLVVTGDSVSMCSEATATRKPLRIFSGKNWLTPKHQRFIQSLYDSGYAIDLCHPEEDLQTPQKPLNTAQNIADAILNLIR